jgi:hypothetical protein
MRGENCRNDDSEHFLDGPYSSHQRRWA